VRSGQRHSKHARQARRAGVALAALLLAVAVDTEAPAFAAGPDDREACANAAEQGQQLRDEGKYRRAREQMLVCARQTCPGPIQSDCGKWLTELDRDAPTVVFGARDARGNDVVDLKISMDGQVILERLDGKPVLVDSGEHTFKFEAKDGTSTEQKVLLRAAEKARPIIANLGGGAAATGTPPQQSSTAPTTPDTSEKSEPSLVPVAVAGGIGILALGSFALFGIMGKSDVDNLQGCKPYCKEADVDSARTKLIIADISLGVGVVGIGVAAFLYFTRPKVETKVQTGGPAAGRPTFDWGTSFVRFHPTPNGIGGTF
jgi:hypothetical protein